MMSFNLSTEELEKFLYSDILLYHNTEGVFAIDKIPNKNKYKKCFIINSDPSFLPGQHWIAIFLPSNGLPEFFDSFGKSPSSYSESLLNFLLDQNSKGFIYNYKKIQSSESSTCGLFCLYFLYYRIRGYSFTEILKRFGKNLSQNDLIVIDLYYKHY